MSLLWNEFGYIKLSTKSISRKILITEFVGGQTSDVNYLCVRLIILEATKSYKLLKYKINLLTIRDVKKMDPYK